ncbi:hypothetical protein OHA40_00525 [Nocardia sp. NBC_00508]|uniref:hypothetical protein n=1 Tax=Nocardia sp. NBC_00508 TaxID=2975992 RepID=UPI002E80264F|nr:hypothetical protein [Nocardia sp. NBC_00508]WUD66697.1 hypothetical protein OHA40_00525 [Nocardia sp. NBC_00508]
MQIPAMSLNFAEMAAGAGQSPSGLQQAFFGWIAWALALITTILALLATRWSSRILGGLCILVGLAELVLTAYGIKGTTTWSAVIDGMENMRLGGVLYLFGLVLLIQIGALVLLLQASPLHPSDTKEFSS